MFDYEYALNLRPYLEGFTIKRQQPLLINFRCPLCGDSKTKKRKQRGYIMQDGDRFSYYCHKCTQSGPLAELIQKISPGLYGEYRLSRLKQYNEEKKSEKQSLPKKHELTLDHYTLIPATNSKVASEYLANRQIPTHRISEFYYCADFKELLKDLKYENYAEFPEGKQRLIIPFLGRTGNVIAIQGRALNPKELPRYVTAKIDPSMPQVFGLNRLNFGKTIWVMEGPFDSTFVDNAIALAGSNKTELFDQYFHPYKKNLVFVFDNEPRQSHNVRHIEQLLRDGYKVMIWPNELKNKDLNDMILHGEIPVNRVETIFNANIHTGLSGLARLAQWRKK